MVMVMGGVVGTKQALPTAVSQAIEAIIEHQGAAEQTEVGSLLLPVEASLLLEYKAWLYG